MILSFRAALVRVQIPQCSIFTEIPKDGTLHTTACNVLCGVSVTRKTRARFRATLIVSCVPTSLEGQSSMMLFVVAAVIGVGVGLFLRWLVDGLD